MASKLPPGRLHPDEDFIPPMDPIIKNWVIPKRPSFGTKGAVAKVAVNAYPVMRFPSAKIHQYDLTLGADGSKRALINKLWNHPKLQEKFGKARGHIIFDGSKLAWSIVELPIQEQLTMVIDLDDDHPKKPSMSGKPPRDNTHRIVIRKAGVVPMQILDAYLQGKTDYDPSILACVNFLDHLIRETPAKKYVAIKRSFFARTGNRELEGGVEAWKGIFQSIRCAQGGRMIMNVDVATSCFWKEGSLMEIALLVSRVSTIDQLANALNQQGFKGPIMKALRRLKKVQFFCRHRKNDGESTRKTYTIEGYEEKSAANYIFELNRRDADGNPSVQKISVQQYYATRYNIVLKHPGLPLVRTKKKGEFYPMELCFVASAQRYPFKLNEKQTADMIKFTVQRPTDRINSIKNNVMALDWGKDPVLRDYGLEVDPNMCKTQARILPAPQIQYGAGSQDAKFVPRDGRWDLRGKRFADWGPISSANGGGLKGWGVMIFGNPRYVPESSVRAFFRELIKSINTHGGHVVNKEPTVMYADASKAASNNVFELYKKAGNRFNMKPQILFFVLTSKSPQPYGDIKAYCDIQLGVPSQCLQSKHVEQAKGQYCSNVCMKINGKMGGYSCDLVTSCHPLAGGPATMLLGADVSHSSPANPNASYASMVGSTNLQGTRFAAIANTNGLQNEMISPQNIFRFITTLLRAFHSTTRRKPERILYFRDGVSEGQYEKVVYTELECIKAACRKMDPNFDPKFTVVICSKRHHFRFFPIDRHAADRNSNPVPGTIIERDITHYDQYDFYLNSHQAIQGTARPVHYQVIFDENKIPVDALQALIYNTCYTYIRATCSVSLIPVTYYAHVASARARVHENETEDHLPSGPSSEEDPVQSMRRLAWSMGKAAPLRSIHTDLTFKMWYI